MYYLKDDIEIDFGIVRIMGVAKRIEITQQTLSKILNRKTGCSKVIANYISMLNYKEQDILISISMIVTKENKMAKRRMKYR